MKKKISFVIPAYNEERNIHYVHRELKKIAKKLPSYTFEYVFVDNGSPDNTRAQIEKLAKKDRRVTGIFLTRNFGPEASGWAGFEHSTGDAIIPVECDLQDPPKLILTFVKKWEEGFDVVLGVRDRIEDNLLMTALRRVFYRIFKTISNIDVPVNSGSYCLMSRRSVEALKSMPEKFRFFRGLRAWIGFKTTSVRYKRQKRKYGKSSYNIVGYIQHSERGIFGFSYLPLDIMVYSGFIVVILSFIFIIGYLYTVFVFGNPIRASIPLMLAIVFFGGVTLLAISILGKYIQVIVEETKARPTYIVDTIIKNGKETGTITESS